jgi:hypothetical protein
MYISLLTERDLKRDRGAINISYLTARGECNTNNASLQRLVERR